MDPSSFGILAHNHLKAHNLVLAKSTQLSLGGPYVKAHEVK